MFYNLMEVFREWNKPVTLKSFAPPQLQLIVSGIGARLEAKENDKGFYYVVTLCPDGSNPDYPETDNEYEVIFQQGLDEDVDWSTWSIADKTVSILNGNNYFTKLVVTEKPYQRPGSKGEMFMGKVPEIPYPQHDILAVEAHAYIRGEMRQIEGVGLTVRKSQRESEAFLKAQKSPHHMLSIM